MPHPGSIIGIARYPVKSMAGESLAAARIVPYGIEGDRLFAYESSAAPAGMLRITGAERRRMLSRTASIQADGSISVAAEVGVVPLEDSPAFAPDMKLVASAKPQTDVQPLALLSAQTLAALAAEFGQPLDARRFRANLLLDVPDGAFAEQAWTGSVLQFGSDARLEILEPIPRCRLITYDPDAPATTEPLFPLMRFLERRNSGCVGMYARVVVPGTVQIGDRVEMIPSA